MNAKLIRNLLTSVNKWGSTGFICTCNFAIFVSERMERMDDFMILNINKVKSNIDYYGFL